VGFIRREGLADAGGQGADGRVGDEGDGPRERLVEHQGQRVHVGLAVHRLAFGRLGRHVAGGAHHGAGRLGVSRLGQSAGHAEVGHTDQALLVEKQVGRLDVAVHQAPAVRVGQALCHLGPQMGRLRMGQPDAAVEQVAQRAPAEILQDQIWAIGVLTPVEDAQHVGVVEGGHRPGLGPEALQEGLVRGQPGLEYLDRDVTLQGHVFGQEDVSRGASAQSGEQPVPLPKDPADGIRDKGHRGNS
jgi:hypothetical protein